MLNCNVEVITPEVAAVYLKNNPNNRLLNESRAEFYAKMMRNGEWKLNAESIKFAPDGRLLDGQHRLRGCVKAGVPFQTLVARDVDEDVFDTLDQGMKRKPGHVFYIKQIPNANNVSATIGRYLKMGVRRVTSMSSTGCVAGSAIGGRQEISTAESLAEYERDPEYWQNIHSLSASMYKRCRIMSASQIGAIIAHLNLRCKYDLSFVLDFFNQLFFEEKTKMNVLRALRIRFVNENLRAAKINELVRTQMIRKAWDLYKKGEDRTLSRWQKGVEPEKPFE